MADIITLFGHFTSTLHVAKHRLRRGGLLLARGGLGGQGRVRGGGGKTKLHGCLCVLSGSKITIEIDVSVQEDGDHGDVVSDVEPGHLTDGSVDHLLAGRQTRLESLCSRWRESDREIWKEREGGSTSETSLTTKNNDMKYNNNRGAMCQ